MDNNTCAKLLTRESTEPQQSSPVLHCPWLTHALLQYAEGLLWQDLSVVVLLIKRFFLWRVFLFKRDDVTEFQLQILAALKL